MDSNGLNRVGFCALMAERYVVACEGKTSSFAVEISGARGECVNGE